MKTACILSLALVLGPIFGPFHLMAANAVPMEESLSQARACAEAGDFERALRLYQGVCAASTSGKNRERWMTAAVGLASVHQTLGQYCAAIEILENAKARLAPSVSQAISMKVQAALGNAYLCSRRYKEADFCLRQGLALAGELKDPLASAAIMQNFANLLVTYRPPTFATSQEGSRGQPAVGEVSPFAGTFEEGVKMYEDATALARSVGDNRLLGSILLNESRAHLVHQAYGDSGKLLQQAAGAIHGLAEGREKAFLLTSYGRICGDLAAWMGSDGQLMETEANRALHEAERLALATGDLKVVSYANSYLGHLAENHKRWDEALTLSVRGLFAAQQTELPEARFECEWQIARLLRAQNQAEAALQAYRRALRTFHSLRSDLSLASVLRGDGRPFRETTGRIFLEMADLILQRATPTTTAAETQATLAEARNIVESLKTVELEEYFYEDDCANLIQSKVRPFEHQQKNVAVVYFIPLPDRLEIIVSLAGSLRRFTSPLGARELAEQARSFRNILENPRSQSHLEKARSLWQPLLGPFESQLPPAGIDTLVFVPEGALATVPMAALHDGNQYLIQRYAVAVAPGLALVEPRAPDLAKAKLLACGISRELEGFSALEAVPRELESIHRLFPGKQLLNEEFRVQRMEMELAQGGYSIVHIAAHGTFGADASQTFILAFDQKLSMDRLEQVILPFFLSDHPIELLTLSGCQTAAGDDRAALGLAGIAVKAGARSALASLWSIHDAATQQVMAEFYAYLKNNPGHTKARALQQAQQKLIQDAAYGHPSYWSPFLIIGNWL